MRDAVGGTFMIKLILVFLAVYIIFMGAALNYAKAFRVKNKVMDIIEQNEGMEEADFNNLSGTNNLGVTGKINEYLSTVSYNVSLTDKNKQNKGVCFDRGYCIDKKESTNVDGVYNTYYKVTTFVKIEFPFFKLNFTIPIAGEARKIERINR